MPVTPAAPHSMPVMWALRACVGVLLVHGGLTACASPDQAQAATAHSAPQATQGTRILVGFASTTQATNPAQWQAMERASGSSLTYLRPLSGRIHLFELRATPPGNTAQAIRQLQQMPGITSVEPDQKMKAY